MPLVVALVSRAGSAIDRTSSQGRQARPYEASYPFQGQMALLDSAAKGHVYQDVAMVGRERETGSRQGMGSRLAAGLAEPQFGWRSKLLAAPRGPGQALYGRARLYPEPAKGFPMELRGNTAGDSSFVLCAYTGPGGRGGIKDGDAMDGGSCSACTELEGATLGGTRRHGTKLETGVTSLLASAVMQPQVWRSSYTTPTGPEGQAGTSCTWWACAEEPLQRDFGRGKGFRSRSRRHWPAGEICDAAPAAGPGLHRRRHASSLTLTGALLFRVLDSLGGLPSRLLIRNICEPRERERERGVRRRVETNPAD